MIGQAQRRLVGVALVALTVLAVTAIGVAPARRRNPDRSADPTRTAGRRLRADPATGIGWDDQPGAGPDDPPAAAENRPLRRTRYGEIAAVDEAQTSIDEQLGQWPECDQQVTAYLGIPLTDGPAEKYWHTSVMALATGFLWPSRVQAAAVSAGRPAWPPSPIPFASTIQRPGRVDFTLRGGWSNPRARPDRGVPAGPAGIPVVRAATPVRGVRRRRSQRTRADPGSAGSGVP